MRTLHRIALGVVAVLAVGGPALALVDAPIEVDVPFDFVVGDQTLSSGTYVIEPAAEADPGPLVIHRKGDDREIVFDTEETDARAGSTASEVVFDDVDGRYYLCQVWQTGNEEGNAVSRSAVERESDGRRTPGHGHRIVAARAPGKAG